MDLLNSSSTAKKVTAAKSVRGRFWFIRVDGPKEFLKTKLALMAGWIDTHAVYAVYHIGDKKTNPHCHICYEMKPSDKLIQKQALAVRLKELFSIEQRSQYAIDVWDGIRDSGAGSYLWHEQTAEEMVNVGWSDEEISQAQAHNASLQKVLAVNREKASNKLVDKAVEYFMMDAQERVITKKEILRYVLKACRLGENYYPGSFVIKKYVEEVQLKITSEENFEDLVSNMYSELWRSF